MILTARLHGREPLVFEADLATDDGVTAAIDRLESEWPDALFDEETRAELRAAGDQALTWQELVPLGPPEPEPFPIDAPPPGLREFVLAVAHEKQVPVELPALIGLAVVASTLMGVVEARPWPGFRVHLSLYVVVVMDPGERKTPLFNRLVRVLWDREKEEARRGQAFVDERNAQHEILTKEVTRIKDFLADNKPWKGAGGPPTPTDLNTKLAELRDNPRAYLPRRLVGDVTIEKKAEVMSRQGVVGRFGVTRHDGRA